MASPNRGPSLGSHLENSETGPEAGIFVSEVVVVVGFLGRYLAKQSLLAAGRSPARLPRPFG